LEWLRMTYKIFKDGKMPYERGRIIYFYSKCIIVGKASFNSISKWAILSNKKLILERELAS